MEPWSVPELVLESLVLAPASAALCLKAHPYHRRVVLHVVVNQTDLRRVLAMLTGPAPVGTNSNSCSYGCGLGAPTGRCPGRGRGRRVGS